MKSFLASVLATALAFGVQAVWYWPFGSDEKEPELPRLSVLVEPASLAIDEASDLMADGRTDEAVECYRKALAELERVENENPERAATPEFATVRVKRAYVNAAIDSILLEQARSNAKAVAVTDTTELEKKFAAKRAAAVQAKTAATASNTVKGDSQPAAPKLERQVDAFVEKAHQRDKVTQKAAEKARATRAVNEEIARLLAADPKNRKARLLQAGEDVRKGDYEAALLTVRELLEEKPNDAAALNLRAMCEISMGNVRAAEATLDQAINSNPRDHYAYYNMVHLMLNAKHNRVAAERYYETGRAVGGPKVEAFEKVFKKQ